VRASLAEVRIVPDGTECEGRWVVSALRSFRPCNLVVGAVTALPDGCRTLPTVEVTPLTAKPDLSCPLPGALAGEAMKALLGTALAGEAMKAPLSSVGPVLPCPSPGALAGEAMKAPLSTAAPAWDSLVVTGSPGGALGRVVEAPVAPDGAWEGDQLPPPANGSV
jgi:hypothetical protein